MLFLSPFPWMDFPLIQYTLPLKQSLHLSLPLELQLRGRSPVWLACNLPGCWRERQPQHGDTCTACLSGGEARCMGKMGVGWREPGMGTAPQPGPTAGLGAEVESAHPHLRGREGQHWCFWPGLGKQIGNLSGPYHWSIPFHCLSSLQRPAAHVPAEWLGMLVTPVAVLSLARLGRPKSQRLEDLVTPYQGNFMEGMAEGIVPSSPKICWGGIWKLLILCFSSPVSNLLL